MLLARYFDGVSARGHPVSLQRTQTHWLISGEGVERQIPVAQATLAERLGSIPRRLELGGGAYCEVADQERLHQMLLSVGERPANVEWLQRSRAAAVLATLALVGMGIAGYVWVLPLALELSADRLPPTVRTAISTQTLGLLDSQLLQPSTLEPAAQDRIRGGFHRLQSPADAAADVKLLFRSAQIGPNALALPDGTVIVLDALVALANDDEQVLAVVAHELGHVHHQHGIKLMLRNAVLGGVALWWLGDFSALMAGAPAALLHARYSRELETEADDFAAAMLLENSIAPSRLADFLEKMAADRVLSEGSPAGGGTNAQSQWLEYLATHPGSEQRAARLRAM